jgi:hypothetical protein
MTDKQRLRAGRRILIEGEWWWPRKEIAAEIGITDRAAARLKWPTAYIGRVAHCPHDASLKKIADDVKAGRRHKRSRSASVAA